MKYKINKKDNLQIRLMNLLRIQLWVILDNRLEDRLNDQTRDQSWNRLWIQISMKLPRQLRSRIDRILREL
jgi:hypothetical protein